MFRPGKARRYGLKRSTVEIVWSQVPPSWLMAGRAFLVAPSARRTSQFTFRQMTDKAPINGCRGQPETAIYIANSIEWRAMPDDDEHYVYAIAL